MGTRVTNYQKLKSVTESHKPIILYDVEATGIMNGNDNHITQIALTAFNYNPSNGRYELQDNLFMLAKAQPVSLAEIDARQKPTKENAERILKGEYIYAYRTEISRVIQNCRNRQQTLIENRIPTAEQRISDCTPRQVKRREGIEAKLQEYKDRLKKEQDLEASLRDLFHYIDYENIENIPVEQIDKDVNALLFDKVYTENIGRLVTTEMYGGNSTFMPSKYAYYDISKKETIVKPYAESLDGIQASQDDIEAITRTKESICFNLNDFINKKMESKLTLLREYENLSSVLKAQGIDKEKWIQDGLGLTTGEMQVGINEFLSKYKVSDTVFVTNGTYYANHYMKKDGLFIDATNDGEIIDLIQVEKTRGNAPETNKWSANIGDFAAMYLKETGKEIKTFDAYTKALCYAEMIARAMDIKVSNRSVNQLANAVSEKVASMDEDYVMSATRASVLNWKIATDYEFSHSDYHFNCLEYVDFGNERKYVDIDKMFEVNDNFEVTLEGDKEPIKTWEELENKIKALNSNISEELLEQIKFKYEELEKEAMAKKEATKPVVKSEEETSSPVLKMQQEYSSILAQFDTELAEKNRELENLNQDYEIQKNLKLQAVISDIRMLTPFLKEVNKRGGRYYDDGANIDIYYGSKHLRLFDDKFSFGYTPKSDFSELPDNVLKNWIDLKNSIIKEAQYCLKSKIECVTKKIDKTNESINKMMER